MGVSFDSPETNLAWATEESFEFELWSDLDRVLALYYGAADTPTQRTAERLTFLLDAEGSVLLVYDPVNPATNAYEVLSDCEALFGG